MYVCGGRRVLAKVTAPWPTAGIKTRTPKAAPPAVRMRTLPDVRRPRRTCALWHQTPSLLHVHACAHARVVFAAPALRVRVLQVHKPISVRSDKWGFSLPPRRADKRHGARVLLHARAFMNARSTAPRAAHLT